MSRGCRDFCSVSILPVDDAELIALQTNISTTSFTGQVKSGSSSSPAHIMDIGTFCSICDVTFTSETHAESHYTGKKHRKKEDFGKPRQPGGTRRSCVPQKPGGESAPSSDWSPSKPTRNGFSRDDSVGSRSSEWHQDDDGHPRTPNESGHLYYCNPCMKNFSGPSPMKQHMSSPSHDKQVNKLKAKFAKDSCRDGNNNSSNRIPYWTDLSRTGQPRQPAEYERSSESSEGSGKIFTPPKGDAVRSGSVASLQSLSRCSGANDFRGRLIDMCTVKLKEELGRIIPSIAESVVESVLGTLIREEKVTHADERSQDQDGNRLNLERSSPSPVADDSGENGQKLHQCSTGTWVEKHTQAADADESRNTGGKSAACSPTTSEGSEHTNAETDNVSENSELASPETGAKVVGTRDGDTPTTRCELTEHQRCFQDRNGIGVQQRNATQTTASTTNYSEANEDDYVEIYGVQIKKGKDFEPTAEEPIATDSVSSEETMFDLKSATRGELEPRGTNPRVVQSMMTAVGHNPSVSSQDLIDFEEMKNAQNAKSVVVLDHQMRAGDPQMVHIIDHQHTGNYDSRIECKSPKGSEGDPHDTASFQKHGGGSPVMDLQVAQSQRFGLYYGTDDNGRRPFTGDQPLAEESGWRYH